MATSTVAAVSKMAHFLMALAILLPIAVADQATIAAATDIPDYFQDYMMTLSLDPAEAGPVPFEYPVVPLTRRAGLNITNLNILNVTTAAAAPTIPSHDANMCNRQFMSRALWSVWIRPTTT
jgi:hypothetical protein